MTAPARPTVGLVATVVLAAAVASALIATGRPARAQEREDPGGSRPGAEDPDGRQLFLLGCASCHGPEGAGSRQGPSLLRSGGAAAYYYLSTGRMPLTDPEEQPQRKRPAYDPEEMAALVLYVAELGDGPDVPVIDPSAGDLALGGARYRALCAPCHSASGAGGALSYGRAAPTLHPAEPLQIASAMRVGPGQMPVFGPEVVEQRELNAIVRYAAGLGDLPSPGGVDLGGVGPIPEGFVAWIVGMGGVILATLWIGKRARHD